MYNVALYFHHNKIVIVAVLVCVCPQNLEDIKAREAYLRQQRDRLLKMKTDSHKNISARSSASPEAKSTTFNSQVHTSPTHKQGKGHQARQEGAAVIQSGETKKQRSSGVLCSAIASKLKRGHK